MKKLAGLLTVCLLFLLSSMTVMAAENKTVVALGADLTGEQRATVLNTMGLTEADLANCQVVTITNDMEHKYLDAYVDSSVIGTKSLSSVMLKPGEVGSGVLVTTHNINYCTTGMYRNALLTAGVTDTAVTVVGPTSISGTAALIGALKGYESLAGVSISDSTIDTAMNELITTGAISAAGQNSEAVEELIAYIKAKQAAGELNTDEDIKKSIAEAEQKFGVTLSEDEVKQILDLMDKIGGLGLNVGDLLDQAQDLYAKFGDDIVNKPDEAIAYVVKQKVSGFFSNMGNSIKSFFGNLFK